MAKGESFFKNIAKKAKNKSKGAAGRILSNLKYDGGVSGVARSVAGKEADALRQQLKPIAEEIRKNADVATDSMKEYITDMVQSGIHMNNISRTGNRNLRDIARPNSGVKGTTKHANGTTVKRITKNATSRPIPKNRQLRASTMSDDVFMYNGDTGQIYAGVKNPSATRTDNRVAKRVVNNNNGKGSSSNASNATKKHNTFKDLADTYTDMYTAQSKFAGLNEAMGENGARMFNKASGYSTAAGKMAKEYFWDGANTSQRVTRIGAAGVGYMGVNLAGRYISGGNYNTNRNGERDIAGIPFV